MSVIRSQCVDEEEYRIALRDDFAAKAMNGLVPLFDGGEIKDREFLADEMATQAYTIADAMLKARATMEER